MDGMATQAGMTASGDAPLSLTIDTTQAGSASDTFILPTTDFSSDDYVISWGDGDSDDIFQTGSPSHTYASSGIYTVTIVGSINHIRFNNGGDKAKVLESVLTDEMGEDLSRAFWGCSNQTSISGSLNENTTDIFIAFRSNNLTEWVIDLPDGITTCREAWQSNNITSWDTVLPSSLTDCLAAWRGNNLTSWDADLPAGLTNCERAWLDNNLTSWDTEIPSGITSLFVSWLSNNLTSWTVDLPSGLTSCQEAWASNNLTSWDTEIPLATTNCDRAWRNNALDQTSVDFILVNINAHGTSNGTLGIDQGTNATPSATGQAATDALRARGWTVTLNGY